MTIEQILRRALASMEADPRSWYTCDCIGKVMSSLDLPDAAWADTSAHQFFASIGCASSNESMLICPEWWSDRWFYSRDSDTHDERDRQVRIDMLKLAVLSAERAQV